MTPRIAILTAMLATAVFAHDEPKGKPVKWVEGKPLNKPVGIAWQGDRLLIADPHAKALFEVSKDGKISQLELAAPG